MFEFLAQLLVLVFVLSSMTGMGLGLTVPEIVAPLKDRRLIMLALALNFLLSPALAIGIVAVFGLDTPIAIGLVLMSLAAGAPFLPKLAQMAKADVASAVGLMVVLMVVTVGFLPIALPLLLRDVVVAPWDIARPLLFLMLLPLAAGLFLRARYGTELDRLRQSLAQAANLSLIVLAVLGVAMNFQSMLGFVGSRGLIAIVVLIVALVLSGLLLGGPVLGLGTGQRNISAALLIAGQNFGIEVVTYIIVASVLSLVALVLFAGEFGRRASTTEIRGQ